MKTFRSMLMCVLVAVVGCVWAPTAAAQAAHSQPSVQDLDTLLAPIALYPDALVVQILQCATSPYQVKQVNEWLQQNPGLKGTAAQEAAQKQGFDASFVAIVIFPDVLKMLADKPDWTRQLGQAFTTNRDDVLSTVQRLRKEAMAAGNLKTTQQQTVQTVTTDGQQVIVIEPANPQVVYVPQYNPQTVYTQPASSTDNSAAAAVIGFAAGVIVGAAADNDDDHYYYASGGWGYARPICYPGGYNDWYDHRENMANDYYDYRTDMANQRGENQQARRDDWNQGQDDRQTNRSDAQSNRQDQRGQNQSTRQDTRSQGQQSRQDARSNSQQNWQSRGSTSSRGAQQSANFQGGNRTGTNSGAFSGYQRGSTERASSQRGRSSLAGRGGGRSRGGRRR